MSDEQYTKLFKYIDERLTKTEQSLTDEVVSLREEVRSGFDQVASRLDDDDTERAALSIQVDRHEGWIKDLASKTDTKLAIDA